MVGLLASSSDGAIWTMRAIFEALGVTVQWDEKASIVTVVKGDTVIKLKLGEWVAYVNYNSIERAVPAEGPEGTTMVSLRFAGEALGTM
jgi:hypothetical protein